MAYANFQQNGLNRVGEVDGEYLIPLAGLTEIGALIAVISEFATLNPGDVILTGTPPGAGHSRDPPDFPQGRRHPHRDSGRHRKHHQHGQGRDRLKALGLLPSGTEDPSRQQREPNGLGPVSDEGCPAPVPVHTQARRPGRRPRVEPAPTAQRAPSCSAAPRRGGQNIKREDYAKTLEIEHRSALESELDRVVDEAIEHGLANPGHGILVTRTGQGTFRIELSEEVPQGTITEADVTST